MSQVCSPLTIQRDPEKTSLPPRKHQLHPWSSVYSSGRCKTILPCPRTPKLFPATTSTRSESVGSSWVIRLCQVSQAIFWGSVCLVGVPARRTHIHAVPTSDYTFSFAEAHARTRIRKNLHTYACNPGVTVVDLDELEGIRLSHQSKAESNESYQHCSSFSLVRFSSAMFSYTSRDSKSTKAYEGITRSCGVL